MNGWKTFFVGLGLAIVPAATEYIGAVDWSTVVGTKWAFVASGIAMIALRFVTNSSIFTPKA